MNLITNFCKMWVGHMQHNKQPSVTWQTLEISSAMERTLPNISTAVASFYVACGAVRRVRKSKDYSARDYEVYLMGVGLQSLSLPMWRAGADQDPSNVVLDNLQHKIGLFGVAVYPLTVCSTGNLALFYAVPVSTDDVPSREGKFHTLSQLQEISEQSRMDRGTREMLTALDLWLRERHIIPFVKVDTVFLCSREGEGVGGLVKAIIENPIHQSHIRPPEDNLVISLNNPVFEMNTTQDTAITSNA